MSESEHCDSEFYYPGELSDAEILQLPTTTKESHYSWNEAMLPREASFHQRMKMEKEWSYDKMPIEHFHMTSRQPYWCSKTMKRHVGVPNSCLM